MHAFLRLFAALLFAISATGCAALFSSVDQPEALDPFHVTAPAEVVYDEALALAFDRGYHIAYAAEDEGLLEMERLDRRFPLPTAVRRLDLLVRETDEGALVHARYHSFSPGDPDDLDVTDEDRKTARAFVQALRERLSGYAERTPQRP